MPALSGEEQREVGAELARRKRLLIGAVVVVTIAAVPVALALPLWCLLLYAAGHLLWTFLMVRRHRQVVASCRANGYEG